MSEGNYIEYPDIQRQASRRSLFYQKASSALLIANLLILVTAAVVDTFEIEWLAGLYPKTTLLLASIALAIITKKLSLKEKWYASRSLSETLKTLTWRYAMGAAPFNRLDIDQELLFLERLEWACIETNGLIGSHKFYLDRKDPSLYKKNYSRELQIDKAAIYIEHRLTPQLKWYSDKAKHNTMMSKAFFFTFITSNIFAVSCSAWQETVASSTVITGLFIALSTALVAWVESRKYSELSAAYSLTYSEIDLLDSDFHNLPSYGSFSDFVQDAESLFSREHTQWAAKRGYISKIEH